MFNNPIIQRYRFSQFRLQQLLVFGILYGVTLLLIFFINASLYSMGECFPSPQDMYQALFIQFSIIQVLVLWLFMPMNCSNVIPREIAAKSLDFFRMLPLSPAQKAIGILIGRNLLLLLIAGINLAIMLVLAFLGGISENLFLQLLFLMVTVGFALNSISLLSSVLSYTRTKSTSIPVLILLAIFAFGPLVHGISQTVTDNQFEKITVAFLNIELPLLCLISSYALIAGIWFFAGIRRRFSAEYEPLFNRKGAIGFQACYLFLVYALYHSHMIASESISPELFYSFYSVTILPLLGICLLSIKSFNHYIEFSRRSSSSGHGPANVFLSSNLSLGISLFLMWAITTGITSLLSGHGADYVKLTAYFLAAWLFLLCLIELYAIYHQFNEKIGYLLIFIAGLYLILPMIISGIFENEYIAMFSPFGFIYSYEMYNTISEIIPALVYNLLLLLVPLIMIYNRYLAISKLRFSLNTAATS